MHNAWHGLPEWAKPVFLTAAIAILTWIGRSTYKGLRKVIAHAKQKRLEKLAARVDALLVEASRGQGSTPLFPVKGIATHLKTAEADTKRALEWLKSQGKVQSDQTGIAWSIPIIRRIME